MKDFQERWRGVILRLIREAQNTLSHNKGSGMAIITMHVVVDGDGTPWLWVVKDGLRVEPSKDAREVITSLVDA
jgi:hypothetical protein